VGIAASLLLVCLGALIIVAADPTSGGLDLNALGVLLLAMGAAGTIVSLFFWSTWGGIHLGHGRRALSRRRS
jgi:uncharacterized membrane protein YqjE